MPTKKLKALERKTLPEPLPLRKLLGPSFILLGLGLGSGEFILWPYLSSNFGLGIIWGAVLGLTFQFFMNMEIERYSLARGESIFTGFARRFKFLPFWFLISTFVPWIWPGIAASSASLLGSLLGLKDTHYLAIALLILMGFILSLGPVLYKTVETFQKLIVGIGVPSIFLLAVVIAEFTDVKSLFYGLAGRGIGYNFLPLNGEVAIPVAVFLAALAYSGAGGNLNLAQSLYIREKGYGMGKYAGKITSLITGRSKKGEEVSLTGAYFGTSQTSLKNFKIWWRNVNIEHFIVFWLTGTITILLLSLLAFSTTFGLEGTTSDINFIFLEAQQISQMLFPAAGVFFILIGGLTLFGTQMTVFDATSRILSENVVLAFYGKVKEAQIPKIYYSVLWIQILTGVVILLVGFKEPLQLLILAAVLNAFAMFVHVGFTLWTNLISLEKELRPSPVRIAVMLAAFLFYGGFSIFNIIDRIFN